MAVLVSQVVDAVLAAVDSDAGPQLVAGWCSERYRELTNRSRFRHLLRLGELLVPAVVTSGTVTATPGSPTIVGDATARAAWAALGADAIVDRYFRADGERNWYRIVGLTGANGDLALATAYVSPFNGADPATDAAYKIVKRFHALPDDLRHIGVVTHPRLYAPLDEITHQELDLAMTSRVLVADVPQFWAQTESAADGWVQIEVYPYARTDQLLPYTYYVHAPVLTIDSRLPGDLDPHILKTGALIDVHRWEMAKALRENKVEVAATWRNEMNTLVTRWEDKIREAVKQDRASDSLSLQWDTSGFPSSGGRMVRDARDYVYVRGNRP